MRPVSPCRDCNKRKIGCHASCESYKGFRGALDGHNLALRKSLGKEFTSFTERNKTT